MKTAVVGSRDFVNYDIVFHELEKHDITEIISGGARGADSLAQRYANERLIPMTVFLPDWDKYGKAAGMIRNKDIIKDAEHVIAFWNGFSKGTANSIQLAKKLNKRLTIIVT